MKVCLVLALGLTLLSSGACAQVGEELPLQAGRLQAAGGYAHPPYSRSPARLADGSLLLVGEGVFDAGPWRPTSGMAKLQRRHDQPNTGGPHPEPKRWDPRRRGWVKLPALPICPSGRYALHSVLPLTDGRAWLAGGLCDAPRMADDTSPRGAFSATQLWDPQQQAWQSGPNTGQQRLLHTATLLDDGSAVLAGGMADPSLVQLPGPPVLRSVQRFDGKSLQSLPEMLQARARHSATALPGGRLLVAGGFGASGQALASAELWDPGEARWQALPPLPAPRYGHTALLLADGRLALVGGLNAKHQASDSLLFFEPQTQRWIPGPPLPLPLHSPGAAQLSSGALLVAGGAQDDLTDSVPWAWVLDEGANAWRLGGQASPLRRGEMVEPVTIWPEASGSALLATPAGFLRYRPDRDAQAALRAAPAWARRPEAVALRPDLALWAGTVHDPDAGAQVQTWFWGAAAGWRRVAAPPLAEHAELRLLALRAGDALLLARSTGTEGDTVAAWRWRGAGWQAVAGIERLARADGAWVVSRLEDGRVLLLQATNHVWLGDAELQGWRLRDARVDGPMPGAGAPVPALAPLGSFDDENGQRVPLYDEVRRFLAARDPIHFPALAWDAANQRWFFRSDRTTLSHESLLLPDGCLLSPDPLALFDPRDGMVRKLADPGLGNEANNQRLLLLPSGRLLASGPGLSADRGGAELLVRAGCDGFAPLAEPQPFIDARWAPKEDEAKELGERPPATTMAPVVTPTADGRLAPGTALVLIGFLLGGWLAWRVARWRKDQKVPLAERLDRPRSAWRLLALLRWVLGLLLLALAVSMALGLLQSRSRLAEIECQDKLDACPRSPDGLLALNPEVRERLGAGVRSELPCPLIGDWLSNRVVGSSSGPGYRVELRDKGRYRVTATGTGADSRVYTGRWALQGDSLVWQREDLPGSPLDITPIEPESLTRFVLREQDGSRTRYERLKAVPSTRCTAKASIP